MRTAPVINIHAKVHRGGIERIELVHDTKFPVYTGFWSQYNHMVGEFLEHRRNMIGVAFGENITVYRFFAKSEINEVDAMCLVISASSSVSSRPSTDRI